MFGIRWKLDACLTQALYATGQPSVTRELTQRLLSCSDEDLIKELKSVSVWRYGKVRRPEAQLGGENECSLYTALLSLCFTSYCLHFPTQCELYHWTEVLDRFDTILSNVTHHEPGTGCIFMCPKLGDPKVQ